MRREWFRVSLLLLDPFFQVAIVNGLVQYRRRDLRSIGSHVFVCEDTRLLIFLLGGSGGKVESNSLEFLRL